MFARTFAFALVFIKNSQGDKCGAGVAYPQIIGGSDNDTVMTCATITGVDRDEVFVGGFTSSKHVSFASDQRAFFSVFDMFEEKLGDLKTVYATSHPAFDSIDYCSSDALAYPTDIAFFDSASSQIGVYNFF